MSNSYVADEMAELPQLTWALGTPTLPGSNILNPQTIVFVDANVANAMSLMENLDADVKVLLDSTRDGISQITETLGQYQDLAGISIFSHGSVAQLQLGSSLLNESSLQQYGDRLQQWQSSLTPDADILLYACSVAQGDDGETLIKNFDTLTGADIAASRNPTGASSYGGDWLLEYSTGAIEMAQGVT